jgi:TonB family protein
MNTRDQFGNYLLLKRLSEDVLGETFRAGRVARGALERVVLLRVLNGQGFDGERIARALQARSALAQALKSPNIGQAIDVGQVRGVPYVAYDYVSGRSLAQLLEQAGRRSNPMPIDHALLLAERVALALAVAFEVKLGDERVQHGFVTPQLVQVTNEGEVKVIGFEASTGLRESAAHPLIKQAIGRYLAPESVAGQAPSRADDVYSLGALLFEMLTGQLVPMMPPGGHGAILDQVVAAAEGTHLPGELAGLLKRTLCPRDQRVADVVTWHKALAKLMADGGYGATTFNLAFFLHSLFRDEIDRESRELDSEKSQAAAMIAATQTPTAPVAAPAPATPMAAAAGSAVRGSGPIRDESAVLREEYGLPTRSGGGNKNVLIAAGVGAVAVLGVVGYLVLGRGGSEPAAPAAAAPPTAAPAATPAPAQTGMTPEQIQALIAQALEQQRKEIAAGQKASDDQLKALQRQLEDAQRVRASGGSAPTAPAPAVATPAPVEASTPPTTPAEEPAAAAPAQPTRIEPVPEKPAPATSAASAPAATAPAKPAPAPAVPAPATSAASAPQVGELVTMGPGVTPPRIVKQPTLTYPQVAKRMRKEAVVSVRLLVDEFGRVADAQTSSGKVGFGMDEAALAYARNCVFEPARKGGVKVKIWHEIKVAFKL